MTLVRTPRTILCFLLLTVLMSGCGRGRDSKTKASPTDESSPTALASPSPSPSPQVIKVAFKSGKVETAQRTVDVKLGEAVRIEVDADVSDELHVHAYDKKTAVQPGQIAVIEFTADIPGSFEVELEHRKVQLFELRVQ